MLKSLAALSLIFAGTAHAQPAPLTVVELFTSQGCSSCPPADAVWGALAKRGDVLPLSLPVDYWDNLGWRDTLAQHAFTERQYAYAAAQGSRRVYTPQGIVAGTRDVVASRQSEVESAIDQAAKIGAPLAVKIARSGDQVVVEVDGRLPLAQGAQILLIRFQTRAQVAIGRGENGGRKVEYWNVVTDMKPIGTYDGTPARLVASQAPAQSGYGYAVIAQMKGPGQILGAARIEG